LGSEECALVIQYINWTETVLKAESIYKIVDTEAKRGNAMLQVAEILTYDVRSA
jgi:hypothetical protein